MSSFHIKVGGEDVSVFALQNMTSKDYHTCVWKELVLEQTFFK
jgi:hypothetical protein